MFNANVKSKKRCDHDGASGRYLAEVSDTYILDETSGIYTPRIKATEHGADHGRPFWIAVVRDWPALLVSIGTLLLLMATVHYARKQWQEARASAKSAALALKEAQEQTGIQRQEVEGNLAAVLIVDSPRPTPFPSEERSLKNQGLYLYFSNAGRVAARKIKVDATMARLNLPHFDLRGHAQSRTASKESLAPEDLAHPSQGFGTEEFHLRLDTDDLSLADIENVKNETEAIRVNGVIEYNNGFGHRIPLTFCFMYARIPAFDDLGRDVNGVSGTWSLCDDMVGYIKRTYRRNR